MQILRPSAGGSITPAPQIRASYTDFLPKETIERGKKESLYSGEAHENDMCKMTTVNINSNGHADSMHPFSDVMKVAPSVLWLPLSSRYPQFNHRKNISSILTEEYLQNTD